jgi:uncharacterized protein involved in response to NO
VPAIVDGSFLVVLAIIVWWTMIATRQFQLAPVAILISLYAYANVLFHLLPGFNDLPRRFGLAVIMVLLAFIGGRVTPNFTQEYVDREGLKEKPAPFSGFDALALMIVAVAALTWTAEPRSTVTGGLLAVSGLVHLIRLARWRGWVTWREPLVVILHIGYGWLVLALLVLGGEILGSGLVQPETIHIVTAGAVGAMTLGIMTRATLGHTGRPVKASAMTVLIFALVNMGALFRTFGVSSGMSLGLSYGLALNLAAVCWSAAYLLYAVFYGSFLLNPDLDEEKPSVSPAR